MPNASRVVPVAPSAAIRYEASTIGGQAQSTDEPRPTYLPFRYDEDWSFLSDSSKRSDWLDPLKHIPLGRENWYATIGGEARERFELLDQPGFGTGPVDKNGYFLQRYLLSSDFHLGTRFRAFAEIQSGLENGRNGGPRPTDLDRLDLHQAFVDWKIMSSERHSISIRTGRQELGFGSGRLISPAEGLNTRRSLDGGRLTIKLGSIVWNATALRLVKSSPGVFNDVPDHAQRIFGTGFTARILCGAAQTCRCITSHSIDKAAFFRRPLVVRFAIRSVPDFGKRAGDGISTTRGLFSGALSQTDGFARGPCQKTRL